MKAEDVSFVSSVHKTLSAQMDHLQAAITGLMAVQETMAKWIDEETPPVEPVAPVAPVAPVPAEHHDPAHPAAHHDAGVAATRGPKKA